VTQVAVALGAAVVGAGVTAGAVLLTTRQQIKSNSASVDKQFANERTQRETERMAEHLEL
jgi:hypothetical protein